MTHFDRLRNKMLLTLINVFICCCCIYSDTISHGELIEKDVKNELLLTLSVFILHARLLCMQELKKLKTKV